MNLFPIAVCDDLEEERALLGHILQSYAQRKGLSLQLHLFVSGEELLHNVRQVCACQVLFLDVYMPGISGVEAARRLLARPERPTALFCISDVLALGAVQAARELGLRVPEDLSVVGFDDVEYAVMGHPRLTTVRQPCYELGRTAGELLLTQIQGGPRGRAVYLPHTLIERDSTARCAVGS